MKCRLLTSLISRLLSLARRPLRPGFAQFRTGLACRISTLLAPTMCRRLPSWWGLIEDLLAYLNGATHGSLIQAALVHAQFESIHPSTDGNGRVGRALIHTVLTRHGLTPGRVLPVSLVLSIFRDSYVAALNALRFEGAASMPENRTSDQRMDPTLCDRRGSCGHAS
ncbi:Fic family protein [Trueperella pyogenes]|uniref:Fic family protein n=1 Tax=Trueperella pyogenes TaxID=1661 RepID=UPI0038733A94